MNNQPLLDIIEQALRGQTIDDLVEGWMFSIDEVSSNVYKVDGRDMHGHHVSGYGTDPEIVLEQCIKDAQRVTYRAKIFTNLKTYIAKLLRLKK